MDDCGRFGLTYLITTAIQGLVTALAKGDRARAFKAISTGMLSPLAIIFGLFVVFTAAQVWNDNERANAAVDREASALRAVVLLAAAFPDDSESRLRALIRSHIEEITTQEWPMMARGTASLRLAPPLVAEALQLTLSLSPNTEGAKIAQREIATALETFTGDISVGPAPLLEVIPDAKTPRSESSLITSANLRAVCIKIIPAGRRNGCPTPVHRTTHCLPTKT